MVTSIARQSVILKCLRQKSVLLGNYEFYYIAGLMNRCFGLSCKREMSPKEMMNYIQNELVDIQPKNDQEQYLIKMVSVYRPTEDMDEQMQELFDWGESEQDLWKVETSKRGSSC